MLTADKLNPKHFATTPEIDKNLATLLAKLQRVEKEYGHALNLTNCLRDMIDHKRIYADKNAKLKAAGKPEIPVPMGSKHLSGQAADIADADGKFWKWCMEHMQLFVELGLYFEDRSATPTWVHLQTVPPKSGKQIFMP